MTVDTNKAYTETIYHQYLEGLCKLIEKLNLLIASTDKGIPDEQKELLKEIVKFLEPFKKYFTHTELMVKLANLYIECVDV